MKMLKDILAGLVLVLVAGVLMPRLAAETIAAEGGSVTFSGATASKIGTDLVLVFSDPSVAGSFTIDKYARAQILVVGGGGAGGSVASSLTQGAGGGGGAGGVSARTTVFLPATYAVTVGKGGSRVQTVVSSWVGEEGGLSSITSDVGYFAQALGGGGGGSVKVTGGGTAGGSGGGGSWYKDEFTKGGTGTEGMGWAGGTPTAIDVGGGGGGAATNVVGRGGADGTAGAGRVSDITGTSVTYATGGRGGQRGVASYVPEDGTNPGDGGDGAGSGYAGAGANGIVVVRITKLFTYTKVAYPEYTTVFSWTNGNTYTSFDLSSAPAIYQSAIASVTGTNSVTCEYVTNSDGTITTNGLGRFYFTLKLNDDYVWDDGSIEGSSADLRCTWRVKDPDIIGLASVDVDKTVSKMEGTNATISINIHMTPETRHVVPNVLVLGSLCGAHGLSSDVINSMLNAITEVGNVDYFYFNRTTQVPTSSVYSREDSPYFQGSMSVGETRSGTIYALSPNASNARVAVESASGNHGTMYGFYNQIYAAITNGTSAKYDYIVFSFDRTRVAERFDQVHPHEAEVAAYLKQFYEKDAVIWLVDNQPANDSEFGITQTPWFPSQLTAFNTASSTGDTTGWETLDYGITYWGSTYFSTEINDGSYGYRSFNALMGLFDPKHYPVDLTLYKNNLMTTTASMTKDKIMATAGDAITNQVVYSSASDVVDLIEKVVQAKGFTTTVSDSVNVSLGLALGDVTATWTSNATVQGWVPMTSEQLVKTDTGVRLCISNLVDEAWIKLLIGVTDTGTFLSSQGATYDERTGKWTKDPNDGPVVVEMMSDSSERVLATGSATTSVQWEFTAYKITASVKYGQGAVFINGFQTGSVSVGEGYSPEVTFRGDSGWMLDYLEVDGLEITDFDPSIVNWIFKNVAADHDIKVGFIQASIKLLQAKQRYPWNNLVDIDYFIGSVDATTGVLSGRLVFFVEYDGPNDTRIKKQLKTFRDNTQMFHQGPFSGDGIHIGDTTYDQQLRTLGYHRVTWDANADGVDVFQKKKLSYTLYVLPGTER